LARDQLLLLTITANVGLSAILGLGALYFNKRRKIVLFTAIVLLDSIINSQALLFFAPNSIYSSPSSTGLLSQLNDTNGRVLIRNFNNSYTDYGSYWEALVVRAPFSDSFVDQHELQTAEHLKRLRDGLTPDWNMPVQVPIVNGYTTLLPTSYQRQWENPEEARINALSQIPLDHPQLQNWAVKYYVVDTWFTIDEQLPEQPPIYQDDTWRVYELPALSRFRFANDQVVTFTHFSENPNRIAFTFTNNTGESYLKIADRYESGWQATVNDQAVRVENWDELRAIPIAQGENQVVLEYRPSSFIIGGIVSLITLALLSVYGGFQAVRWVRRRPSKSPKKKTKKN
jgi:hypothetical protein